MDLELEHLNKKTPVEISQHVRLNHSDLFTALGGVRVEVLRRTRKGGQIVL